jgi:hypothetical protein
MTPQKLYELLDKAGVVYDVVETFEGVRLLSVEVDEDDEDDEDEINLKEDE